MSTQETLNPVVPTDDGLAWMIRYSWGLEPGPLDTVAVGTGTGDRDLSRSTLRNEVHREPLSGGSFDIVPDNSDPNILYGIVELGGGLELDAGTEVTEAGFITTATSPETLAWLYKPPAPIPFPSGERNEIVMPMPIARQSGGGS
jgi:hypothetical protein